MLALMRRHPRRSLVVAAALAALLGWSVWRVTRPIFATPNPTVDSIAAMNELVRSWAPEGDAAWPIYREFILDELGYDPETNRGNATLDAMRSAALESLLQGDWDDPRHERGKEILAELSHLFPTLDRAAAAAALGKPYYAEGDALRGGPTREQVGPLLTTLVFSELGVLRRLERLNTIGLRAAAETGDWDEVVRRFRAGIAMQRQLMHQASVLEHIVGMSILGATTAEASRLATGGVLTAEVCAAMDEALADAAETAAHSYERWSAGEALIVRDFIQWTFSDDGRGDGVYLPASEPADFFGTVSGSPATRPNWIGSQLNLLGMFTPSRRETLDVIDEHWRRLDERVSLTPAQRAADQSFARFNRVHVETNPALDMIIGALGSAIHQLDVLQSHIAGTRVLLRLASHYDERGVWPDSLAEAVGDELALDPVSGERFVYERPPGDGSGRPFELRIPWIDAIHMHSVINPARDPLLAAP